MQLKDIEEQDNSAWFLKEPTGEIYTRQIVKTFTCGFATTNSEEQDAT